MSLEACGLDLLHYFPLLEDSRQTSAIWLGNLSRSEVVELGGIEAREHCFVSTIVLLPVVRLGRLSRLFDRSLSEPGSR